MGGAAVDHLRHCDVGAMGVNMAKLVICCRHIPSGGGPDAPSHLRAYLGKHPWPGGGYANTLLIDIGADTVEVRMIDRDQVIGLLESLTRLLDDGKLP